MIGYESFFQAQLTAGITDTDTNIPLDNVPTPSEGFLVIEPNTASREIIYYTSKDGSSVTVPAGVGNGRGYDGTTAAAHLQNADVIMAPVGAMFETLQDGTAIADAAVTPAKLAAHIKMVTIPGATLGSTGNKAITGVGFTPKYVEFETVWTATATNARTARGAMTATAQFYSSTASDTAGTTVFGRTGGVDLAYGRTTPGGSTNECAFAYVSMDADGFTVNVSIASSTFDVVAICHG